MPVELRRIASFLSFVLFAGLLPAQAKPKSIDELRKENAALRQQVKTLRAQLDAKTSKSSKKIAQIAEGKSLRGVELTTAGPHSLDILIQPGTTEVLDAKSQGWKVSVAGQEITIRGNSPTSDRRVRSAVDEIERALLDVRRALWKLEQAETKGKEDRTKKDDKQPNSVDARVMVPILTDPVRLELDWPILSRTTVPMDQLSFSFRRF